MPSSALTGRSGVAAKTPAHAANHGRPPSLQEPDPNVKSIWEKPVDFSPYLTLSLTEKTEKNKNIINNLSSGRIWKQLRELQANSILKVDQKADCLMFKVSSEKASSNLQKCKTFCGLAVTIEPHSTLNCSKGVIKNSWLKRSTPEELEELEKVKKAEQIIIKKNGNLVKTGTWIITFSSPTCPPHMDIYWLKRVPVQVFIPKPMRCYKCQRFGHQTKHCHAKSDICARCGAKEKHDNCTKEVCCPNCKGAHSAADIICPTFIKTKKILQHRATHGGTFADAREAVCPKGKTFASVLKNNIQPETKNKEHNNFKQDKNNENITYIGSMSGTRKRSSSSLSLISSSSPSSSLSSSSSSSSSLRPIIRKNIGTHPSSVTSFSGKKDPSPPSPKRLSSEGLVDSKKNLTSSSDKNRRGTSSTKWHVQVDMSTFQNITPNDGPSSGEGDPDQGELEMSDTLSKIDLDESGTLVKEPSKVITETIKHQKSPKKNGFKEGVKPAGPASKRTPNKKSQLKNKFEPISSTSLAEEMETNATSAGQ